MPRRKFRDYRREDRANVSIHSLRIALGGFTARYEILMWPRIALRFIRATELRATG